MSFHKSFLLALGVVPFASAAMAELQICNDTRDVQSISIGYKGDTEWTSEGWWNIDPNECVTPVAGDLTKQYYYLRAEVAAGRFIGEDYKFCTTPSEYTIVGDTDCEARGYDTEDFIEINTGETATSFTYRMTQAAMDIAQAGGAGSTTTTPDVASSSDSGLTFCNDTQDTQGVSIGYKGEEDFTSEGWWNVEPGECSTPIAGDLKNRFYYYRAEVRAGEFNGQGYSFCTDPSAYTIVGDTNCEARGYTTEDFAEIDTGETAKGYTLRLNASNSGIVAGSATPAPETTPEPDAEQAGFTVCNDTQHTQAVSIGYEGAEEWTSEGWWNVEPGACSAILQPALTSQYYYYRAEINGGDFDGENYTFCTSPDAYTIVGDTNCEARGYDKETFREVNVGEGIAYYTLTLIPPAGEASASETTTETTPIETIDNVTDGGAGIEVCNDTSETHSVSFGYEGADGWTSEGWWVLDPGACSTPALDGNPHRYLYYRTEVDGGPFEGQSYFFCTTPDAYTIVGDADCEARGYDREDFREIDTGTDGALYTHRIVAEAATAKPSPGKATTEAPTTPTPEPTKPATTPKDGGFDFERNTTETAPVAEPEPTPEPEPVIVEPAPEPEPEPAPAIVEPEPVEEEKPTRRGGSRGGSRGG